LITRKCLDLYAFKIPAPDYELAASEIKCAAEEVITSLPLPGVEESPFDLGDIWLIVILARTDQTSIWETCKDTDKTPCDDTVDLAAYARPTLARIRR